jgi:ArsR family transcriptional regulator
MFSLKQSDRIARLMKLLSDPFRVRLLLALSRQEACVCHLERLLAKRQAYISQHLMVLREEGLLTARRDGKYIFYTLKDRRLLNLFRRAAELTGSTLDSVSVAQKDSLSNCACPTCAPPNLITIQ